jgi:intracellular multiplication protein IcmE
MALLELIPRRYMLLAALAVPAALCVIGAYAYMSGSAAPGASRAEALLEGEAASEVGGAGTPEYNLLVETQNERKAAEARAGGESFAAVPTGVGGIALQGAPSPLVRRAARPERPSGPPAPAMRERPSAPAPQERRKPREAQELHSPGDRALAADLKSLREASGRRGTPSITLVDPPEKNREAASEGGPSKGPPPSGLAPGTVLYATTDLGINSDAPAPVVATVAEGPFKGAKAIGSFRAAGESLIISFARLIPPSGPEIRLEAVGIDPDLSLPHVRASVDTHFWERWGGLAAASFIEGLGQAVTGRRTRVYVSGDAVVEEGIGKTAGDVALEAAGKVGERAAAHIERGFDRPPTVTVRAGEHVGILVLSAG